VSMTRTWILRTSAVLFGLAAGVLIAVPLEFAARYVKSRSLRLEPATWVADPDLIYRLNPSNPEFPCSFRGKPPGAMKDPEALAVCLGESTTYGHDVTEWEAWPRVTERVLRSHGVRAEVVNAGVPGYGMHQLLLRYRREIAALQPDFVVVYAGWNRTGALVDSLEWVPFGITRPGDGQLRRAQLWLAGHSLLFRKALQYLAAERSEWLSPEWVIDPYHETYVEDLRALATEISARHQRPVLILYPALYYEGIAQEEMSTYEPMLWERRKLKPEMVAELQRKHAAIRGVARETGAALIDVQEALAGLHGQERMDLFTDEMHLTARGNRKVGQIIGDALADIIARQPPATRLARTAVNASCAP